MSRTEDSFRDNDDGTRLIADDNYLEPYADYFKSRFTQLQGLRQRIMDAEGNIETFCRSHKRFGLHRLPTGAVRYIEWAPSARGVALHGDFNQWNPWQHACTRDQHGVWTVTIPDGPHGEHAVPEGSRIKARVALANGQEETRIPAYAFATRQDAGNPELDGVFIDPDRPYTWQHDRAGRPASLRIYEAHVGMSGEIGGVASYRYFADEVIPRIARSGYNCVQLMAVMEHSYYASFGYHVTNFFAPASRSGSRDDLRYLIDCARKHGIVMLMDIVHSHASKNTRDGLGDWDGSGYHYFHAGGRGNHSLWDSRLFDYSQLEVLRFLLSNLFFWIEDIGFDGFRFDGVTSMLYKHHGIGHGFTGEYSEYFNDALDTDAGVYLMLANQVLHDAFPFVITIAEDVSGLPGLCGPVADGGVGFDYRLAMAIPDMWIKMLKEQRDEDWNMGNIAFTLSNRRWMEKVVSYAESHDQAIVGDKTLAFWLMDKEMYSGMSVLHNPTPVVDRGIALHKLIRLVTMGIGGDAYLTFMGNEFGHPEWVDFPREGNNNSFHYCRRQWHLVDDELLRYQHLGSFDRELMKLEARTGFLSSGPAYVTIAHEADRLIVFERGGLVFALCFGLRSLTNHAIGVRVAGQYKVAMHSDSVRFGGHNRIEDSQRFFSSPEPCHGHAQRIMVYLPARTAIILERID